VSKFKRGDIVRTTQEIEISPLDKWIPYNTRGKIIGMFRDSKGRDYYDIEFDGQPHEWSFCLDQTENGQLVLVSGMPSVAKWFEYKKPSKWPMDCSCGETVYEGDWSTQQTDRRVCVGCGALY